MILRRTAACLSILTLLLAAACGSEGKPASREHAAFAPEPQNARNADTFLTKTAPATLDEVKETISLKYRGVRPRQWGERVDGVITRLPTRERVIALTFDACGGPSGSKYDRELIEYLIRENIPATLFVNSRWIDANRETFLTLAKNPLFEIENHGTEHRPLSVTGRSVYRIRGTKNAGEAVEEVLVNHRKIREMTGREPLFFRAGTAYYDEVAVRIVHDVGERVAGFDIVGDGGARFTASQVKQALLSAKPGSIVILHFNQPSGSTFEGLREAVPVLKKRGYRFVKLEDTM